MISLTTNKFRALIVSLSVVVLFGAGMAQANTTNDIESIIAKLREQLASLQSQLSIISGTNSALVSSTTSTSTSAIAVGDTVETTASVRVRRSPEITLTNVIVVKPAFARGTVIDGSQTTDDGMHTFWKVRFTDGIEGWVSQAWIREISSTDPGSTAGVAKCDDFYFSPSSVEPGQSTTATWNTSNVTKVVMVSTRGDFNRTFPVDGTYTVTPERTTTYRITAVGPNNTQATCVATVVVQDVANTDAPAPTCDRASFNPSTVKAGEQTTATWNTSNADSVTIRSSLGDLNKTFPVDGSYSFTAEYGATYTITAKNDEGAHVTCVASIVVQETTDDSDSDTNNVPSCSSLFFNPNPATRGSSVTAVWSTENTEKVQLYKDGRLVNGSFTTDGLYTFTAPLRDVTYKLTAIGSDGTRNSCEATLDVQ